MSLIFLPLYCPFAEPLYNYMLELYAFSTYPNCPFIAPLKCNKSLFLLCLSNTKNPHLQLKLLEIK